MTRKNNRLVSLLLIVCVLASMLGMLTVSAAAPTALDIAFLADVSDDAALAIEKGIIAGNQDVDGVYYGVSYPATMDFTSCQMGTEDYILMAAQAIYALSEGKDTATQISYKDITLGNKDVLNGTGTSLNKAQYVELAERVSKYGVAEGSLPTSFNRPTDGTNVYEGRMSIYSIGHLFAEVLAAYNSSKALPASVEFLPVHMGDVEVTPTEPAPTEPEDWIAAVIDAAVQVKASMDNKVIPGTIMVGPVAVTPAQFQYLACQAVVAINGGTTSGDLKLMTLGEAPTPSGSATGLVYKDDYVAMAKKIITWDENNGAAPNYSTSSNIGQMHYYDVIHMYAKILNFYKTEGMLPNYNTVVGWTGSVGAVTTPTTAPTSGTTSGGSTTTNDWYPSVVAAAQYVVNYVKDKGAMPMSIPVGSNTCNPAQYLYLATQVLVAINSGKTSGELSIPSYTDAPNPTESVVKGTLQISEVVTMAQKVITFMQNNGAGPNYMTSSLGTLHYYNGIHMYSQALAAYGANGSLPATVEINTWFVTTGGVAGDATFGNDYSAYAKYLVPTNNCQSTNATIISAAKTAMFCPKSQSYTGIVYENPTSTWEAMWNLTEYTTYVLDYLYYANTSRGALGVWRDKAGNCCDMAHFTIAMARSLGVPGRYEHWNCRFSNGSEGHVWAALYIPDAPNPNINNENGWIYSDPVNNNCKLGYQSFSLNYEYGDSNCAELPF